MPCGAVHVCCQSADLILFVSVLQTCRWAWASTPAPRARSPPWAPARASQAPTCVSAARTSPPAVRLLAHCLVTLSTAQAPALHPATSTASRHNGRRGCGGRRLSDDGSFRVRTTNSAKPACWSITSSRQPQLTPMCSCHRSMVVPEGQRGTHGGHPRPGRQHKGLGRVSAPSIPTRPPFTLMRMHADHACAACRCTYLVLLLICWLPHNV